MTLIDHLENIKDFRRKEGKRYSKISMLLMIIMAMLRNKYSYREISRFCKQHQQTLVKIFGFKNGRAPSHVSFRKFIINTDFYEIQKAFYAWAKERVTLEKDEWVHIDGKSIRSTVSDYSKSYQNFVSLVSLFVSRCEKIYYVDKLENKKTSEISIVEGLIDALDLKDVIFTFDALHCKKNSLKK